MKVPCVCFVGARMGWLFLASAAACFCVARIIEPQRTLFHRLYALHFTNTVPNTTCTISMQAGMLWIACKSLAPIQIAKRGCCNGNT